MERPAHGQTDSAGVHMIRKMATAEACNILDVSSLVDPSRLLCGANVSACSEDDEDFRFAIHAVWIIRYTL